MKRPEWLRNGCTGAVQKECSPPELLAAHDTQLQTRFGMTGTVQTQERGGAGGAQPPLNCLTHLNAALHCKDQAAISEMVEQEQWGTEGAQPPLNCSLYIGYNFNAGCSAGSAPCFVIRRITPTCSFSFFHFPSSLSLTRSATLFLFSLSHALCNNMSMHRHHSELPPPPPHTHILRTYSQMLQHCA